MVRFSLLLLFWLRSLSCLAQEEHKTLRADLVRPIDKEAALPAGAPNVDDTTLATDLSSGTSELRGQVSSHHLRRRLMMEKRRRTEDIFDESSSSDEDELPLIPEIEEVVNGTAVQVWNFPGDFPDVMVRANANGTDGSLGRRLQQNQPCRCNFACYHLNYRPVGASCPGFGTNLATIPRGGFNTCCADVTGTVTVSFDYFAAIGGRRRRLDENERADSDSERYLQSTAVNLTNVVYLLGNNTGSTSFSDTLEFGQGTLLPDTFTVSIATSNPYQEFPPCSGVGCSAFQIGAPCPVGGSIVPSFGSASPYAQLNVTGPGILVGCDGSTTQIVTLITLVSTTP